MKYNPLIVLAFFKESKLPDPATEWKFAQGVVYTDKAGRERTRGWAFDFAWPAHRIALEVEGGIWIGGGHNRGAGFKKDMAKYNTAAMLGWRIVRVQPKELCMTQTAKMIRQCIWPVPPIKNL